MLSSIGSCSGAGRRAASLSSFEVDRNPSDGNFTWNVRRWMSRDQPRSFLSPVYTRPLIRVGIQISCRVNGALVVAIFCYTNFIWLVPVTCTCTCKLVVKLIWVEAAWAHHSRSEPWTSSILHVFILYVTCSYTKLKVGQLTLNWIKSLPLSKGFRCWGMPSFSTTLESSVHRIS